MTAAKTLQFDHRGNLTPGIIKNISLDEFKAFFIDSFAHSRTRERNYKGLFRFIEEMKNKNISNAVTKIWIDGSFVTNKTDPNDIDMVYFLDANHPGSSIALKNVPYFRTYGEKVHCDSYMSIDPTTIPPGEAADFAHFRQQEKYWLGEFCFDRNLDSKGIIELTINQF